MNRRGQRADRGGRRPGRLAGVMFTASLALPAIPGAPAAQRPDLSGHWELRDRGAWEATERARVAGPPAETGPERGPDSKDRRQVGLLLGMAQTVPAFTVRQDDSTIAITNEDGFSYTLYPDGRKAKLTVGEVVVEYRTRWASGDLVVEWRPQGGGKMIERYTLADNARLLQLDVTVEHRLLTRPAWQNRPYRRLDIER